MSLFYEAYHIPAEKLANEIGCGYWDLVIYFTNNYVDDITGRSYPFYLKNVSPNSDEKGIDNDIFAFLYDWNLEYEDVIYIDF